MKKLITFMLLVAGIVSAQAASVNWTISNVYTPTADVLNPGNKTDGAAKMATGANYVIEALWSADNSTWTTISSDTKLASDGTKASSVLWTQADAEANRNAEGNAYFKVVITYTDDNGGIYEATWNSGSKSLKNIASQATSLLANFNNVTWDYTAPTTPGGGDGGTPEPTSGLLVLVGGAMLALRRKQK